MLHFAVAGSPHTTPKPGGSVMGLRRAHELGITAMELEWVQQVPKNPERLDEIHATAQELDMCLTVHAPYFINLNSLEPEKIAASKKRILSALEAGERVEAKSVCVHPAFYMKMDPKDAYDNVRRNTEDIMKEHRKRGLSINLAFETMGKGTQFGTLEECLKLSKEFGLYPCVDTAHMHARSNGAWNTVEEFHQILDLYEKYLGKKSLKNVHFHYSGIEYSEKGERNHVPLEESDARWREFIAVLKERGVEGSVVCESPILEADTVLMRDAFAAM